MCFQENKTAEIEKSLGQGQCLVRIQIRKIKQVPAQANYMWRNATSSHFNTR
jgi:hypothetical protein